MSILRLLIVSAFSIFANIATALDDEALGAKALFCAADNVCSAGRPLPKRESTVAGKTGSQAPTTTVLGISYWIDLQLANGELTRVPTNRKFATGERIRLSLQPNRPGYLYIFNLGSSGLTTPLFPRGDESARAEAGQTIAVPGKSFLRFASPPGEETLLVVFSPTPISEYAVRHASADNSSTMAIADVKGAKDLLRDDDFDSASASRASYAVQRPGNESKAINLSIRLKHQ